MSGRRAWGVGGAGNWEVSARRRGRLASSVGRDSVASGGRADSGTDKKVAGGNLREPCWCRPLSTSSGFSLGQVPLDRQTGVEGG